MERSSTRGAVLAVVVFMLAVPAEAVPITYRLQLYQTQATGSLGGVPFTNPIIWLTFEGDTDDVLPYSVPRSSGALLLKGTASISLQTGVDPPVVATFLPSAGVYVSVDATNSGIGFGAHGVPPGDPAFPGQPVYPAAMFTGTGAVASYDLKGDFTVTGYPVSCVDFATPSQCAPAIPLATSAGDLRLDFFSAGVGVFIAQTHPTTPFASFTVRGETGGNPPSRFELQGGFALGAGSTGIDPPTEAVTLTLGGYTATVPAGGFQARRGGWSFSGQVGGASLRARIAPTGPASYAFSVEASRAPLGPLSLPTTVGLSIGDDVGSASVTLGH